MVGIRGVWPVTNRGEAAMPNEAAAAHIQEVPQIDKNHEKKDGMTRIGMPRTA